MTPTTDEERAIARRIEDVLTDTFTYWDVRMVNIGCRDCRKIRNRRGVVKHLRSCGISKAIAAAIAGLREARGEEEP